METLHEEHIREFVREVGRCSYINHFRLQSYFTNNQEVLNVYHHTNWPLINRYSRYYTEGYHEMSKAYELLKLIEKN